MAVPVRSSPPAPSPRSRWGEGGRQLLGRRDGRVSAFHPIPRFTHPVAWWLWALGLMLATSRTQNLLLLALITAVLAAVVAARRPEAPWARAFALTLRLGVVVVVSRMLLQVVFTAPVGIAVAFTLPSVPLPAWFAGVRLGGMVTWESLLIGLTDGVRLAVMIACVGAANSLASPSRLLRSLPNALYEIGVTLVVATSLAPSLLADAERVRTARRLRGHDESRLRGFTRSAGAVFDGALERSVGLAEAMDSRGYGRLGAVGQRKRRRQTGLVLSGCAGVLVGLYSVFDSTAPAALGWPLLAGGVLLALAGLRGAGRGRARTSYRPDPWGAPESLTAAAGCVVGWAFARLSGPAWVGLTPPVTPLTWPQLPLVPTLVLTLGLLPLICTPGLPPEAVNA